MKKKLFLILGLMISLTILTVSFASTCTQPKSKPTISLLVWDDIAREEGCKPGVFYLYRYGGDPVEDIVVYYEISGTAKNGYDFNIRDNIRIRGISQDENRGGWGRQPQTELRIKPIDDDLLEGDETVTIKLKPDDNYNVDSKNNEGTIIIQDNEIPDVQFQYPSSEGMESSSGQINIILSSPTNTNVRVKYKILTRLVPNSDNIIKSSIGELVIPTGKTNGLIELDVIDNNIPEDIKTIIVEIDEVDNGNIGLINQHFYSILNDDGDVNRRSIYDKIYGVILGSRAGSSMGAVVEWCGQIEQIEKLYGIFHEFLPCNHYNVPWTHPLGSTEDGIERQKCIATAIIEKQDRITATDLAEIWKRDYVIENMENMTQPYDRILTAYLNWGYDINDLPDHPIFGMPYDLGANIHLTSRVFHPIPLINAGDPEGAIEDTKEIGKLYYADENDYAFAWGGVYNAAIALAMLPDATINSVIEGALKYATPEIRKEIEIGLKIADKYKNDPMDRGFREEINEMYANPNSPYFANNRIERYRASGVFENVTCAFAILNLTQGNVDLAIKVANNRARDTDCTAASAGALAGALTGTTTIPSIWMENLNNGMLENPYTVSHLSNEATAQALYGALKNKLKKMENDPIDSKNKKIYLDLMRKAGIDF